MKETENSMLMLATMKVKLAKLNSESKIAQDKTNPKRSRKW